MRIQRRGGDLKIHDPGIPKVKHGKRRMKRLQRLLNTGSRSTLQGPWTRPLVHQPFYKGDRFFQRHGYWMKSPPPISVSFSSIADDQIALHHPTHYALVDNRQAYLAQQAKLTAGKKASKMLLDNYRKQKLGTRMKAAADAYLKSTAHLLLGLPGGGKATPPGSGSSSGSSSGLHTPGGNLKVATSPPQVQGVGNNPAPNVQPLGSSGKKKKKVKSGVNVSRKIYTDPNEAAKDLATAQAKFQQASKVEQAAIQREIDYLQKTVKDLSASGGGIP